MKIIVELRALHLRHKKILLYIQMKKHHCETQRRNDNTVNLKKGKKVRWKLKHKRRVHVNERVSDSKLFYSHVCTNILHFVARVLSLPGSKFKESLKRGHFYENRGYLLG